MEISRRHFMEAAAATVAAAVLGSSDIRAEESKGIYLKPGVYMTTERQPLAIANVATANGRIYTKAVLEKIVSDFSKPVMGTVGTKVEKCQLHQISHQVTALHMEGDTLFATVSACGPMKDDYIAMVLSGDYALSMYGVATLRVGMVINRDMPIPRWQYPTFVNDDYELTMVNIVPASVWGWGTPWDGINQDVEQVTNLTFPDLRP
jgi:hypothetical protein